MIRWGIIGPGSIARVFCNGLRFSQTGTAVAVASRDRQKAVQFADLFSIDTVHASYDALLADDGVDAVYVATIHPAHLEWVEKAAAAGKHILVEKPMGMNAGQVGAMVEAARSNDVFLMEAFMYRCHPQMQKLAELIADGAIGPVRVVRSAFGYRAGFNPARNAAADPAFMNAALAAYDSRGVGPDFTPRGADADEADAIISAVRSSRTWLPAQGSTAAV